jgi:ADP-heptose:LPS heptosyltransferase
MKIMEGLFITSSRIGDAVMTLSMLEALRHEDASLTYRVAADPLVAPLFYDDPSCIEIISFPKQKYSGHWLSLFRQVKSRRFDWVIDTRGSAIRYFLNTKKRFTFHSNPSDMRPKVVQLCEAIRSAPFTPKLYVSKDRSNRLNAYLPDGPILAVAPIANWIGKQWPIDKFKDVLNDFLVEYPKAHILIIAAPHEADQLQPLVDALPGDRIINGIKLIQAYNLSLIDMAALMKGCSLFLGNDSGILHMAYALNLPVIGLYGPSEDSVYGPYPKENHTVLRISMSYKELKSTPNFSHKNQICYMDSLSIDSVKKVLFETFR